MKLALDLIQFTEVDTVYFIRATLTINVNFLYAFTVFFANKFTILPNINNSFDYSFLFVPNTLELE